MDVNLSSDEFDNTADTHEGICSSLFSQYLAHPWEFISGLTKKKSVLEQKIQTSLKEASLTERQ